MKTIRYLDFNILCATLNNGQGYFRVESCGRFGPWITSRHWKTFSGAKKYIDRKYGHLYLTELSVHEGGVK